MNDDWDDLAFQMAAPSLPVDDGLCVNCKVRPATMDWVGDGGAFTYVQGGSVRWCERCAVKAQLDHARKMAEAIPALEQRLRQLP